MDEQFSFTRSELREAFALWILSYRENPDNYDWTDSVEEDAKGCADALLDILREKA